MIERTIDPRSEYGLWGNSWHSGHPCGRRWQRIFAWMELFDA